jgi:tripartite-type tricarboxylate transporter receptor subunit TctC
LLAVAQACTLAIFLAFATGVCAQEYPSKSIRFIMPFGAGGALDIIARVVTAKASEYVRTQMIVENRTGAGGIIGTEMAARAAPDGYTLLVCNFTNATYPALYKKRTYEPLRDFIPITLAASFSFVLAVHPSMPVKSVRELVGLSKRKPGQVVYGSSGIGSPPHFAAEMLSTMTGIQMIHVPYAGNPQAQQDLLAGQIQVLFINTANALPLIQAGRVRGLAVSTLQRNELAPQFPTMNESGLSGFEMTSWAGFCAPATTSNAIVEKLNEQFMKALASPDVRQKLRRLGFEVIALPLERFRAYFQTEIDKYTRIVREAKIEAK